jgi:hypothetical protein
MITVGDMVVTTHTATPRRVGAVRGDRFHIAALPGGRASWATRVKLDSTAELQRARLFVARAERAYAQNLYADRDLNIAAAQRWIGLSRSRAESCDAEARMKLLDRLRMITTLEVPRA